MSCCHRRSQTVEILLQTTFKGFHRQHYTQIPQNYEDPSKRMIRWIAELADYSPII